MAPRQLPGGDRVAGDDRMKNLVVLVPERAEPCRFVGVSISLLPESW
jgi:hypothetical protein